MYIITSKLPLHFIIGMVKSQLLYKNAKNKNIIVKKESRGDLKNRLGYIGGSY